MTTSDIPARTLAFLRQSLNREQQDNTRERPFNCRDTSVHSMICALGYGCAGDI